PTRHLHPHPFPTRRSSDLSQGAKHAVRSIAGRMKGRQPKPFRYRDKGNMAIIGRRSAVAELPGGLRVGGTFGWISWLALHLALLDRKSTRLNSSHQIISYA